MWTADGWMIVEDGDTSQWNRSGAESAAIGPGRGIAVRDADDEREVVAHDLRVAVRREGGEHGLVELGPGAQEPHAPATSARSPR